MACLAPRDQAIFNNQELQFQTVRKTQFKAQSGKDSSHFSLARVPRLLEAAPEMSKRLARLFPSLKNVSTDVFHQGDRLLTGLTLKQAIVAISVIAAGLTLGLKQWGGILQPLELMVYDQMVRWQPDPGPDPRLLVVAITEADIQAQQSWPLSDQVLAQLLSKLQQHQPQSIGLDLYRNIPHPPGHKALQKQFQAPNLFLITKLSDAKTEGVAPFASLPQARVGFNDLVMDPDGVIRRNFLYASQGQAEFYSLSLRLSLHYLAASGVSLQVKPEALQIGQANLVRLQANSGGYNNIDATGYQILLSYRSANVARQITLRDVLQGDFNPAWVKDKVILIGTTAPSLKDRFLTPYSWTARNNPGMPGVLVQAQLVSQLLSLVLDEKPLFWFWPEWGEALWIWTWALVGGAIGWRLQHPLILGLSELGALGCLLGSGYGFFTQAAWIPLVSPMLALAISSGGVLAYKLLHSALHDPLTGLPNRVLLLRHLRWAIARTRHQQSNRAIALLILDLDRFQVINDSLGYHSGDQLLSKTAQRLRQCLGHQGVVARVGGDEFAVLLENHSQMDEATQVASRIEQEMAQRFQLDQQLVATSVSVGIALSRTECRYKPEDLLQDAFTAMYRAKALGKARHEVFSLGMRAQAVKSFQVETRLRQAFHQEAFQLYYQPIVQLRTGSLAGFEALVRLREQSKILLPGEFITIAEETSLIVPLGEWVIQEACRQQRLWHSQFQQFRDLSVSVNLSSQQLCQPNLVEFIERTLRANALCGHNLKLEVTESTALGDVEATIDLMLRLRALQVEFSIDDFGTGYSSLSYLRRLPVSALKIDQSFTARLIDSPEDAAVVRLIIMLSHALGVRVIAEGVETEIQRARLQDMLCDYGQGYLFSKPLDGEATTILLQAASKRLKQRTGLEG